VMPKPAAASACETQQGASHESQGRRIEETVERPQEHLRTLIPPGMIEPGHTRQLELNAYVIATETRAQAVSRRDLVIARRNPATIAFFREVMKESQSAAWAHLDDRQMVDSNAGFDAGLIGSFENVLEQLLQLSDLGVDTIVCQFDDPMRDAGPFMKRVIQPLRKELAARQRSESAPLAPETVGRPPARVNANELSQH